MGIEIRQLQKSPVVHVPHSCTENPVVSVIVTTYQHEDTIERCLNGVLMQKTNFPIEILIGEDESSDRTREICLEYAEKFPDRIRLFLHSSDNKISIGGRLTGRFNFLYLLKQMKGSYFAICEGDDYWTDEKKLEMQVAFMEANPEFSLCYHRVHILEAGRLFSDQEDGTEETYQKTKKGSRLNLEDLLVHGNFIHTPSVLGRAVHLRLPWEILDSPVADFFIYTMLAEQGDIARLDKAMATYRKSSGTWSSMPYVNRLIATQRVLLALYASIEKKTHKAILAKKIFEINDACAEEIRGLQASRSSKYYFMKGLRSSFMGPFLLKVKAAMTMYHDRREGP